MKAKLVAAFAVLLFASAVHADEITTDLGVLYIPDGSVVTSIGEVIFEGIPCPVVSFSFADGTGTAEDQGPAGAIGSINFTTPVSDLSVCARLLGVDRQFGRCIFYARWL